ncbi:MAG TPA: aromatic ring-hydroxylating dioxygenase subunit alpha [Actinomycetospora sp.]|nr:aromatic ring-hydroxylating dioxygenase subunit alpha [Actinomycetospora sp.]
MLLEFWYPLAFSTAVRDRPTRVDALGRRLVLWRARSGSVSALSDVCVHRGGSLSGGRIVDGTVTCPYHGWAYRADGTCARIPAHPGRPVPPRARVDAYPVRERYGIVWGFLGRTPEDGDRPPLPEWPEAEETGWRRTQGTFRWSAHYTRVVEGGLDFSHAPFVHASSFGAGLDPAVADFAVTTTPWSGAAHDDDLGGLSWHLPSSTRTDLRLGRRRHVILQAHLPLDETATLTHWIVLRDYLTSPLLDGAVRWANERVLREDRRVVEDQRPELLPYDLSEELHVRSDGLQLSYRRRRRELIADGWPTMGSPERATAPAVLPSPGRSEPATARTWVHRADTP